MLATRIGSPKLSLPAKLRHLNWPFVVVVLLIALVGYAMLYAAAGGAHSPWAWRHGVRFGVGLGAMLAIALIDVRFWFRVAYPVYAVALIGLVAVEAIGIVSMGAQRWINLGLFQLQPSEVMKIGLVLALARWFHGAWLEDVARPAFLALPVLLIAAPVVLVFKQPDLGTAIMLAGGGAGLLFLAGVRWWKFALVLAPMLLALPLIWQGLHEYQKTCVMTFLDPERDPLGAGYHIIQSKIALGSGGLWGKGFLQGTQSQLSFLPEKQTDFVFTMLAEETGLVGALGLLALFVLVIGAGVMFALRARSQFARLLAMGITLTYFLYVVINIAMVTGLIPVVGVPLPMISYGGTAMLTVLVGFGLLLSVDIHRDVAIPRFPVDGDH
jgi:rod shape determining protein RodA